MTKKIKTTFEEFMKAKTAEQRKEYEEGYRDFLLSELILAAMEEKALQGLGYNVLLERNGRILGKSRL